MVELSEGIISIDNIDISQVPLHVLRSKLSIIPQDPVLFSGNLRNQLDPFSEYTDTEIWDILEKIKLADTVRNMKQQLFEVITENGGNLSQGQKQLLCIGRTLLKKSKILILDEATSAIDTHTDDYIQHMLRNEVLTRNITLITIAHRLHTISDYDMILVLDNGKILEYDSSSNLLQNKSSVFAAMVAEYTYDNEKSKEN
jgi:ABC-type multidrug transport system fused ATPase/permease subunit